MFYLKKLYTKLHINNFKMSSKLLIIYFFASLIPLLLLFIVFYINISNEIKSRQTDMISGIVEQAKIDTSNIITSGLTMSNNISNNILLNEILNKNYNNSSETFDGLISAKSLLNSYLTGSVYVNKACIYSENTTLFEATQFSRLNGSVKQEKWFIDFENSNRDIFVGCYEEGNNIFVSIIREIDCSNFKTILKLDIHIYNFLKNETNNIFSKMTKVYIYDSNGKVVTSNNVESSAFVANNSKLSTNVKKIEVPFVVPKYLNEWKIVALYSDKDTLENLSDPLKKISWLFIPIILFTMLIIVAVSYSFIYRLKILSKHFITNNDNKLTTIDEPCGTDEIGQIINQFNNFTETINSQFEYIYQLGIKQNSLTLEKTVAELKALQFQMNPHFLYNSLSTLYSACLLRDEQDTANILLSLSEMLRTITSWKNDKITVKQEVKFINNYLKIQKFRFEDKILYKLNVTPDCYGIAIPKMIIQPLVENASTHGLEPSDATCTILINICLNNNTLVIKVEDTGVGINTDILDKINESIISNENVSEHIALKNIYKRLKHYYDGNFEFKIDSKEGYGTKVTILLPTNNDDVR